MNRFFCVVCNKIKRVQHYPPTVTNRESETPSLRKGSCARHTRSYQRESLVSVSRKAVK